MRVMGCLAGGVAGARVEEDGEGREGAVRWVWRVGGVGKGVRRCG